jgi:hypothetical protein
MKCGWHLAKRHKVFSFMVKERVMKSVRISASQFFGLALSLIFCFPATILAHAQTGDPAIWLSAGLQSSGAYVDASAFCGTSGCASQNFCTVVNQALHALPAAGGVVDARGINPGGSNTCGGTTPYTGTNTIMAPSILLLPSGTISIGKTWILPNASKIIGEGAGASGYGVTTLQASSSFTSGGWMIQMGPNSSSTNLTKCASAPLGHCTEIAVEDLTLQGSASLNGIIDGQSQDMSYVKRVNMYQIGGIGLKVWQDGGNSGQNSGPYSDIFFDAGSAASSSTVCAEIENISTRGIHGLTCQFESSSSTPPFAVQIGSSNNSVRDAHISGGFTDGIQVASGTSDTLLFNITGGSGVEYLIDLLSGNSTPNVAIMGASNGGSTYTLYDEMTSTKLNDSYLAMYVLGESGVGTDGYTRFTTSVNSAAVTWSQGSGSTPSQCNKGALYSNTSSTGNLYVCTTTNTWNPL